MRLCRRQEDEQKMAGGVEADIRELEKERRGGRAQTYMALNSGSCKNRKMVESKSVAPDRRAQDVSDGGRVPQIGLADTGSASAACAGALEASFSSLIAAAVASAAATAACEEAGARLRGAASCSCSCCSCGAPGSTTGSAIWQRSCVRL